MTRWGTEPQQRYMFCAYRWVRLRCGHLTRAPSTNGVTTTSARWCMSCDQRQDVVFTERWSQYDNRKESHAHGRTARS